MKFAWIEKVPEGVSYEPEVALLRSLSRLAPKFGFRAVPKRSLDRDVREAADLVLEGEPGRLLLTIRPKTNSAKAEVDVQSRPSAHYKTRHVRFQKGADGRWLIVTNSDIPLDYGPDETGMPRFVTQMFAE